MTKDTGAKRPPEKASYSPTDSNPQRAGGDPEEDPADLAEGSAEEEDDEDEDDEDDEEGDDEDDEDDEEAEEVEENAVAAGADDRDGQTESAAQPENVRPLPARNRAAPQGSGIRKPRER